MDSLVEPALAFIERNQDWAPWIMILLAAAETTAFLSVLVPSTAIMVALGAIAATGALSFTQLWIGATIGALIGSYFSYWLGYRYGDAILSVKPLNQYPEWIAKARGIFAKWGPATVFIGHFVTFLRPVVFMMAGISRMGLIRFSVWNFLGCMAWAYVIPKFGELGGHLIAWVWNLFGF